MFADAKLMALNVGVLRHGSPNLNPRIERNARRSGLPTVAIVVDLTPFIQVLLFPTGKTWTALIRSLAEDGSVASLMPAPPEFRVRTSDVNPRWVYGVLLMISNGMLGSIQAAGVTTGEDSDLLQTHGVALR